MALSLILALLLFNPAPIYILDEIDSALDLSHTQNIGRILKNHFKRSQVGSEWVLLESGYVTTYYSVYCRRFFVCSFIFQFIVVSLKDGMYNNASVLFKTKFVDGMSTVTRHTNNEGS